MDFTIVNKQFSFFANSLLYNKTNQHRSIYDSYNSELANTKIKSITFENAFNTNSTFNSVKFDTSNPHDKFLLHNEFVVWCYKGSSIALLSNYASNPVFLELLEANILCLPMKKYFFM